jgi:hypothetical protein
VWCQEFGPLVCVAAVMICYGPAVHELINRPLAAPQIGSSIASACETQRRPQRSWLMSAGLVPCMHWQPGCYLICLRRHVPAR